MPQLFEQVALKPARYHVGGGIYRDLTAREIQKYIDGTKELLAAGYEPPIIAEHAAPGSDEGAPRAKTARDERAEAVKHGAGWMKDVRGTDGAAAFQLEVCDDDVAKSIRNGSIKFTSPELRDRWIDGHGRVFTNIISHVALTHKPRNPDQGPFEPVAGVAQFSLEDAVQMAAEETEETDAPREDTTKPGEKIDLETQTGNPDLPDGEEQGGDDAKRSQRIEAIIAHLEKLGVSLPADSMSADEATLLDRMLTALMTACKALDRAETEEAEDEPDVPEIAEERPNAVQQYSLAEVEAPSFSNKLLARVIKNDVDQVKAKLDGMVKAMKIGPAVRDRLLAVDGVLQFSADGEFLPALTLPAIVDALDACLLPGSALTEIQLSSMAEEHPNQDFVSEDGTGIITNPEVAKRLAAADMASRPGMYQRK